jgi:hypothetical protein
MDELENLLAGLAQEAPPADSLARVAPKVKSTLRRRAVTRYFLAAAAMLAAGFFAVPGADPLPPLPRVPDFAIPAPDFALSKTIAPVPSRSHLARPKAPKATVVAEDKLKLASTDPNVVIYWSL